MNKSTGSKNQTPDSRSPGARPVHTARTPLFPHKQPSLRIGPQQVQGAKRRSEPLTARTDLESSKAREKGILAHHAILGEVRGERSEAAKREAPPLGDHVIKSRTMATVTPAVVSIVPTIHRRRRVSRLAIAV